MLRHWSPPDTCTGICPRRRATLTTIPRATCSCGAQPFVGHVGECLRYWPGEDTKLCMLLTKAEGKRIVYEPEAVVYHHRRALFWGHFRQVWNYAVHRGFFAKRYPDTSLRPQYFVPSTFVVAGALGDSRARLRARVARGGDGRRPRLRRPRRSRRRCVRAPPAGVRGAGRARHLVDARHLRRRFPLGPFAPRARPLRARAHAAGQESSSPGPHEQRQHMKIAVSYPPLESDERRRAPVAKPAVSVVQQPDVHLPDGAGLGGDAAAVAGPRGRLGRRDRRAEKRGRVAALVRGRRSRPDRPGEQDADDQEALAPDREDEGAEPVDARRADGRSRHRVPRGVARAVAGRLTC